VAAGARDRSHGLIWIREMMNLIVWRGTSESR
jgi:hypothetical protein